MAEWFHPMEALLHNREVFIGGLQYGWFLLSVFKERYGVNRPICNIGFHAIGIGIPISASFLHG